MKLNFLTNNQFKIACANMALQKYDIEVVPINLDIPEIQADTNIEIARESAKRAVELLGAPVAREDHGFFLDAYPGWPGPYMAHTERILPPEDLLRLLEGKERTGYFEMALAYLDPSGDVFESSFRVPCSVSPTVQPGAKDFGWDPIITFGSDQRTISEYNQEDRYKMFLTNFERLGEHVKKA